MVKSFYDELASNYHLIFEDWEASIKRMCVEASQRRLDVQGFVADLLDLSLIPEGYFDAVICMDNALPHLDGQDQVAQATTQIRRKLRPGGLFVASIRDLR